MSEPKLEIFKIKLKPRNEAHRRQTFRNFFRKRLDYSTLKEPYESEDIFRIYHQDFFKEIDSPGYKTHDKKKKGFSVAVDTSTGKRISKISTPIKANNIINGVLDGGVFGRNRNLGKVDNLNDRTAISKGHIVTDEFYFLLYTPLDHNEGILMVQGYTDIKVSDIFRGHLEKYFSNSEMKSVFEYYLPESLKDKYLKGATLSTFTFTTGWHVKGNFDDDIPEEYDFNVKIEITDKNPKVPVSKYKKIMMAIGDSTFKINNIKKELSQFQDESTKIKTKEGKSIPIIIDNETIKPVILLASVGVEVDIEKNPLFTNVNEFCHQILDEIKLSLLPENAAKEL